jgi:hypothetical protein
MNSSIKQNWLIELTNITNQERDDSILFIKDPLNHENIDQDNGLVCAAVSLLYRKTREL